MTEPFSIGIAGQPELTPPDPTGELLYTRSTLAGDVTQSVSINGAAGVPLSPLDGRIEVPLGTFTNLTSVRLSAAATGEVRIFGEGEPAGGRITVLNRPAQGDSVRVTLSGQSAPVYQLLRGAGSESFLVRCGASVAGSLDGKYFDLVDTLGAVRVWFTAGGAAPAPTTPPGGRLIHVTLGGANVAAEDVAVDLTTALNADGVLSVGVTFNNYLTAGLFFGTYAPTTPGAGDSGFGVSTICLDSDGTYAANPGEVMMGDTPEMTAAVLAARINRTTGVKAQWTIACLPDLAGSLDQKVMVLPSRFGTVAFWIATSIPASPPAAALAEDFEVMVLIAPNDGAGLVAAILAPALTVGGFFEVVSTVTNTVTVRSRYEMPLLGASSGTTGFTITATVPGVFGSGSWFVGTETANPYVTATVSIAATVTITDRLECARSLGWDVTETVGVSLAIDPMIGGQDGQILATIVAGETHIFNPVRLETHDLSENTLPGNLAPTLDPIYIGSSAAELWFKCSNIVTPIPVKYQVTNDPTLVNWVDGANGITALDNRSPTAPLRVTVAERAEFIRIVIESNANVADTALDARVNWGR